MGFSDIVDAERPSHCCVGCGAWKEDLGSEFKVCEDVNCMNHSAVLRRSKHRYQYTSRRGAVKVGHPLLKDSELTSMGIRSHMVTINYRHASGENSKSGKGSLAQERYFNIYSL
jgi:hypothetical protein